MERTNWDDLRYVLAVAEEGSVSGAARRLGVNHATVLRRIAAFEAGAGVALFDRTARGYSVPPDRRRILEAAREVESAVQAVGRLLRGAEVPLSGAVRLTSTDTFCQAVLPPVVAELRRSAPGLRIELLCSNSHTDLARTHADVTVRPAERLPDELHGVAAARLGFAAYTAREGEARGWLGLSGPLARSLPARWMAGAVEPGAITGAADSFLVLRELAAAGQGTAILPCCLGDADARLARLPAALPVLEVDVWVASHADLAGVPRIAQVRALLAAALARRAEALRGRG